MEFWLSFPAVVLRLTRRFKLERRPAALPDAVKSQDKSELIDSLLSRRLCLEALATGREEAGLWSKFDEVLSREPFLPKDMELEPVDEMRESLRTAFAF